MVLIFFELCSLEVAHHSLLSHTWVCENSDGTVGPEIAIRVTLNLWACQGSSCQSLDSKKGVMLLNYACFFCGWVGVGTPNAFQGLLLALCSEGIPGVLGIELKSIACKAGSRHPTPLLKVYLFLNYVNHFL